MKKNTIKIALAITLYGVSFSANSASPSYAFTDLGTLGGPNSYANAINNAGQVVGAADVDGNFSFATVWNGTIATGLDTGGFWSTANAINEAGQVAGTSTNAYNNVPQATVWNGSTGTKLGGDYGTRAFGINNLGQVVGRSTVSYNDSASYATLWNGTSPTYIKSYADASDINNAGQVAGFAYNASGGHATVWNGSITTDLGTLGGIYSSAFAINDAGQVAGYSYIAGNTEMHATVWNGTSVTDLGKLIGGTHSYANAINNSGQIAGFTVFESGVTTYRATVWNETTAIDLNSFLDASSVAAGWVLLQANGINDNGWIVGNASNSLLGISSRAFLLTPIPEPETYIMLLVGLTLVGFVARRRTVLI